MAQRSGGTIPPEHPIADANQAMAILDTMHFWCARRTNREGGCPGVEVSITHAGRRVSAQRQTFPLAVIAAMAKLRGSEKPMMRLVR